MAASRRTRDPSGRPSGGSSQAELSAKLEAAEQRRVRDARALSDTGGAVGLPLATALKRQLSIVARLFKPRTAFILLHDPITERLTVAAVRGRADRAVVAGKPGAGVAGEAFADRRLALGWTARLDRRRGGRVKLDDPLLAVAVARHRAAVGPSESAPVEGGDRAHRLLAVPMLSSGRCVGVLVLIAPNLEGGDAPGAADAGLLLALGAQGAAAVEIARLRDDALRRSRDLETALAGTRTVARHRTEALGTIAHELRTPLSTVKGYLSLLQREQLGPIADSQRQALDACVRNTERIQRLIHDLLLASRLQAGRMELDPRPIGLKSLLAEALLSIAPLASEQDVSISIAPGQEAFVRGNRDRLIDVLLNVLDNAVRYNRKGGEIFVRIASQGAVARIEVVDNGPGIAAAELAHVFDRYIELDVSPNGGGLGVGLGLAIVRQVVDRHGGRVSLESQPGRGTTCTLDLPLFAGVASGEGPASTEPAADGRILLVEDDVDCRGALQLVLQNEGYEVEVASGGREALEALARDRPAIVLLDLHMPDLDGRLLLRRIRREERLRDLPVYVISGAIDSAAGIESLAPGESVEGVFEKPLNFPRLLESLANRLGPRSV